MSFYVCNLHWTYLDGVGIKEILKALNNFLAASKTKHCFCSEILLFQSNLGSADVFTDKSSSQIEHFISLK